MGLQPAAVGHCSPIVSESHELRDLKRLLRAGFTPERVNTRVLRRDGSCPIHIETTVDGSKAQFQYSDDEAERTETGIKVEVNDGEPSTEVQLRKGDTALVRASTSKDFTAFASSLHPSLNHKGERQLRPYANNDRFHDEIKDLYERHENRRAIAQTLLASGGKVDGQLLKLLVEMLRTRDWGNERFRPLKDNYIEVEFVLLAESKRLLDRQKLIYTTNPKAKKYGDIVEDLLNNAVWFSSDPFIQRALRFLELVKFDVLDALVRASEQGQHVSDLLRMLAARTPIPARQGIPHLLDMYRRFCETLRPFVDALSDAVCLVDKLKPLSPNTGYEKRVEVIRKSRFAGIVNCLDPQIRHSESHNGTVIDDMGRRVVLTELGTDGTRRTLGEYSYVQVSDMTLELQNSLFVAVLVTFALHYIGILTATVTSREYISALSSIGNLAD